MSAQMGGKKSGGSNNSSMVNTPASTPISTMANGQQASPPPNNAPKYGTLVPNRIFVGGISANTTETELLQLFSNYGTVKAAKIIQDRAGVSKGYGFITFESEDDAKRLQRDQDNIVLRERKLNIAPAIKKQPFSRAFDGSSPPAVAQGFAPNFFPPGSMPFFQGGLAYYPQPPTGPADPANQPPAVYPTPSVYQPQSAPPQAAPYQPVMFPPQPIYMPQQYPMPMPYDFNYYANGGATYIGGNGGGQNGGQQQAIAPAGAQVHQQQQQRPNSPPRPHCYPPQLQNTAAGYSAQDVYYNMPMYQVEGAIYTDPAALEAMALASGVVPEDYQQQQDDYNNTQPKGGGVVMRQPPPAQVQVAMQPPPPPQSLSAPPAAPSGEPTRQTTTPVVSLLSLDHQQEKDLLSMQSGRRRKPPPSTPPAMQQAMHHTYMPAPQQHQQHIMQHAGTNGFSAYAAAAAVPLEYHYAHIVPGFNSIAAAPQKPLLNGCESRPWQPHSNTNAKRGWRSYDPNYHNQYARRSIDTGISSPRTDSNSSSASMVTEEVARGEDKRRYSQPNLLPRGGQYHTAAQHNRTTYNYHPTANTPAYHQDGATSTPGAVNTYYQRRMFVPSSKTQYRNSNRPHYTDHNHQQPPPHSLPYRGNNAHAPVTNGTPPPNLTALNNNNNTMPTAASINNNNNTSSLGGKQEGTAAFGAAPGPAAMSRSTPSPGAFVSQMQPMPQHFVAPARHRNRRTMRRGGGLGEIGAGDAPLTSAGDAITDACNKMDSLKL